MLSPSATRAVVLSLLPAAAALAQTEGSGLEAPFRLEVPVLLEADGAPIDSGEYTGHSGPLYHDVTGDGLPDLLVGNFAGHVQVYANVGERSAPRFEDRGLLQADGADLHIHNW